MTHPGSAPEPFQIWWVDRPSEVWTVYEGEVEDAVRQFAQDFARLGLWPRALAGLVMTRRGSEDELFVAWLLPAGPKFQRAEPAAARSRVAVSCTCGASVAEGDGSSRPEKCPRCGAPERELRATDYVARPWEELDARRRMYGVFHSEGLTPDPVAIFRSEEQASAWIGWRLDSGDDTHPAADELTILPVDQLDGVAWNSHELPPQPEAE